MGTSAAEVAAVFEGATNCPRPRSPPRAESSDSWVVTFDDEDRCLAALEAIHRWGDLQGSAHPRARARRGLLRGLPALEEGEGKPGASGGAAPHPSRPLPPSRQGTTPPSRTQQQGSTRGILDRRVGRQFGPGGAAGVTRAGRGCRLRRVRCRLVKGRGRPVGGATLEGQGSGRFGSQGADPYSTLEKPPKKKKNNKGGGMGSNHTPISSSMAAMGDPPTRIGCGRALSRILTFIIILIKGVCTQDPYEWPHGPANRTASYGPRHGAGAAAAGIAWRV